MLVAPSRFSCPLDASPERGSGTRESAAPLALHPRGAATRAQAEAFIQTVYRARYGAEIRHWAPALVSLSHGSSFVAVAGYRRASRPLFLETYLEAPIETLISGHGGGTISRAAIFEVGHFAARAGFGRALMIALGRHLAARGCTWVVCTATHELRLLFGRMGLQPLVLGPARASRLGAEAASWGTYYDHSPAVLAGALDAGMIALDRRA